jgi:hypothetical protein
MRHDEPVTVGELRAALASLPDGLPVVVSYEGGSHLVVDRILPGRTWDYKEGAVFLDGEVLEEQLERDVAPL